MFSLDYFVRIDNLEGDNGARMHVNDLMARLTVSILEMLNRVLDAIPNHDFVRIVINKRYLQNPIYVPFKEGIKSMCKQFLIQLKNCEILMKNF